MSNNTIGATSITKKIVTCEIIQIEGRECTNQQNSSTSVVLFDKKQYMEKLAKENSCQKNDNNTSNSKNGNVPRVPVCPVYNKSIYVVTDYLGRDFTIKTSRKENACINPEHKFFTYSYSHPETKNTQTEKKEIPESTIKVFYHKLQLEDIVRNYKDTITFFKLSKLNASNAFYYNSTIRFGCCNRAVPSSFLYSIISYPNIKFEIKISLPSVSKYNYDGGIGGRTTKYNSSEKDRYNAHTGRAYPNLKQDSITEHEDAMLVKIQSIDFKVSASISYANSTKSIDFNFVSDTFKKTVGFITGLKDFAQLLSLEKLKDLPEYKKSTLKQISQGFTISFGDCFSSKMTLHFLPTIVYNCCYEGSEKLDNIYKKQTLSIGLPDFLSGKWTLHLIKLVQYIMQSPHIKEAFFLASPGWGSIIYYIIRAILALVNRTGCVYFDISLSAAWGVNLVTKEKTPLYGDNLNGKFSFEGNTKFKFVFEPEAGINLAGWSLIAVVNLYYSLSIEFKSLDSPDGFHELGGFIKVTLRFPGFFQRKYDNELYPDEVTTEKTSSGISWTKKFDTIKKKIGEQ